MKKRRESRAQSLEKQLKQVSHEFFDVGHKHKKIDKLQKRKKPRLFYMAKTAPQLRIGQLDLSTQPMLSSLTKTSTMARSATKRRSSPLMLASATTLEQDKDKKDQIRSCQSGSCSL